MYKPTSRRILITGAANGIGAGLARLFAADGHELIITDLDGDAAAEVAKQIASAGGRARSVRLEITSSSDIASAVDAAGAIDVLVNNAGLQHVARLEDFPADRWHFLISVLLSGAADMMRAVLPGMRQRGFGRIVNIGSIHGLVASPFKSAYVAAKHGLIGLSKSVALENADLDITVNTICPAYVRTQLVDRQIAAQARAHGLSEEQVVNEVLLAPMPKKAFVTVEEIHDLAAYLISAAARNVTAQAIAIDGGWTAR